MATRSEYDNFLYFEDFVPGQSYELGSYTVSREQMLAYAREFDPQYFHIDEEAAKSSRFGDIVASGWHTGSILMRLFVDGLLHRTASIAAPGLDEVKWANPVRAGDTLTGTCLIERTRESRSRRELGLIFVRLELSNQHGEEVMLVRNWGMFERRPTSE